ncbi:unnamed protein product [Acanthoscelides obtectus]|uniref:Uncharacterized protein n=1 Tax=Acanthoscelides obtectus TaxID=200917 RepID=A0A9P0JYT0_ACAOB|nr:unnamed protein product [Acanthoscelides obtectus]CAK1658445.1 hypothetical protein AOBTE_LOCUS20897 [Acanthoscelides obtectus]
MGEEGFKTDDVRIPMVEKGSLFGKRSPLRSDKPFPKVFSDMEDADYYIQAAKRLQKKNNGYKLKIIVIPWYSCVMLFQINLIIVRFNRPCLEKQESCNIMEAS